MCACDRTLGRVRMRPNSMWGELPVLVYLYGHRYLLAGFVLDRRPDDSRAARAFCWRRRSRDICATSSEKPLAGERLAARRASCRRCLTNAMCASSASCPDKASLAVLRIC